MLARWFEPKRSRELLLLAGPIILGMSSQSLLNLVDTAMVGAIGPIPQAAAGLGGFGFWMLANLLLGLGTGVQAMCSRRDGEGKPEAAGAVLDSSIVLAFAVAFVIVYSTKCGTARRATRGASPPV